MSTLPKDVKILSQAQQLQHLSRASEATEVQKKCLSAFFRRQPKPVLDKCEGENRHVGAIVFAEQ